MAVNMEQLKNGIATDVLAALIPGRVVLHLLPKVASTSIKQELKKYNVKWISKEEAAERNEPRVAVVRHPLSRLVSCWGNKVNDEVGNKTWAKRFIEPLECYHGMPFEEFARKVVGQPDDECDRHYRSQVALIGSTDGLDYVAKIENLEEGLREISTRYNISLLPRLTLNKSAHKPWQQYYDNEMEALLHDRYKDDFEAFKY